MSAQDKCPVCGGTGGWTRSDYRPRQRPKQRVEGDNTEWVNCPYCSAPGGENHPGTGN